MERLIGLLSMVIKENLIPGNLPRKPEGNLVMDAQDQASAWHRQGADDGPITPVYHLNALACSHFAPPGSTVVDLGCGSGRFAAYLARLRPDLRVIGFDLSSPMVEIGNVSLRSEGLAERVELHQGDMTSFSLQLPPQIALINCLFAIHHLPGLREVEQCLTEIRKASEGTGCGFLIFDLARPRHLSTSRDYPRIFTPDAPRVFQLDSTNSLVAAYTHAELKGAIGRILGRDGVSVTLSRLLPLYQAFWRAGPESGHHHHHSGGIEATLPTWARRQYRALRGILPGFPR